VEAFGFHAVVYIIVQLLFLLITWWALQALKIDLFLKNPNGPQAKTLQILLTIAIGSIVGNFFLTYFQWATRIHYIF